MTPRRTIEIDDDAAEALVIAMLSDAAVLQYKPDDPFSKADPPADTALVEAIMLVLRYYCGDDQYAEIAAMIEGLSPSDDKPALSPSDDAAGDRETARVATTAYREEMR